MCCAQLDEQSRRKFSSLKFTNFLTLWMFKISSDLWLHYKQEASHFVMLVFVVKREISASRVSLSSPNLLSARSNTFSFFARFPPRTTSMWSLPGLFKRTIYDSTGREGSILQLPACLIFRQIFQNFCKFWINFCIPSHHSLEYCNLSLEWF